MTLQSSSFLAVLSAVALLLVSGNAASAGSHKPNGTSFKQNGTPIVAGSTHRDPIVRNPPIVAGSTHNPVIPRVHRKPPVPNRLHHPCPPGSTVVIDGQCF